MELNPKPNRKPLNAETLKDHILDLTKAEAPTAHVQILTSLLECLHRIDFKSHALNIIGISKKQLEDLKKQPESAEVLAEIKKLEDIIEGFKLKLKHYLILTVEAVLEAAKVNKWDLCKNDLFIFLYNGEYWDEIEKQAMQSFLGAAAEKLSVPVFDARLATFVKQLFEQFIYQAYLPKPEQTKGKVLVNLKNGTFEICPDRSFLRQFNSLDFLTYQLPFEYQPQATAPKFMAFLNRAIPDMERQNVLAEYLGYVFTQSDTLKLEKTLLLYGTGANGKSVFFEIVSALLGDGNVCNYSLQSLTDSTGYFRAKLANKLVNYASEINGKLEASVFKQLVSGEPVEARLPYGEPFVLKDYAKLIFNCNELPKSPEHTDAFFRRFLIIPFGVTIPEHEQDTELAHKIIASELSGVFNWVLSGLDRILKNRRFSACKASDMALATYKEESDSVKLFLKEKEYLPEVTGQINMKLLFGEYRDFCIEDAYHSVSRTNFGKRLNAAGIEVVRINTGYIARLK